MQMHIQDINDPLCQWTDANMHERLEQKRVYQQ